MAEMNTAAPTPVAPSLPRRLPGRSPSFRRRYVGRTALWIDDAQLLQESVHYCTQEIQRFALADIQALQVRRTVRGLAYNVVLSVLLLALLLITVFADDPLNVRLTMGASFGVPLAVLLLINSLRGPTCRTTLTTALGPQILPSLSRVRTARRALLLIAANVAAVQGAFRPDEAAQEVDRARQAQMPSAPAPTAGAAFQSYHY